jgi:hypothetical protein
MVQVNSDTYSTSESSNLQNVEFFDSNGNLITSWLESGNSNTATQTVYWLKLTSGIPAASSLTIYMGFASQSTNLLNTQTTGEAPQLSSTYGQYDNGAAEFNYYQAWGGLSQLPNSWSSTGAAVASFSPTYTTFTDADTSPGGNDGFTTAAPLSASTFPTVIEYQANQYLGSGGYSEAFGLGIMPPGPGSDVSAAVLEHNGSPALGLDVTDVPYDSSFMDTFQNNIFSLMIPSQTSASLLWNYGLIISESSTGIITPVTLGLFWHVQFCCTQNYPFNIYWLRTRAYPPNVMIPSATFGSVQTVARTQSSIQSNFNSQVIASGDYVWFNSVFKLKSPVPSGGLTIQVTGQTITLQLTSGGTITLNVPDADITFSPGASSGTTTFDTVNNRWMTTVPATFTDDIFLSGVAYKVPPGVSLASAKPVAWSGFFSGSASFSLQWQFGAAVYTSFSPDYNSLGVKPLHSTNVDNYHNGDHAGTPENFKDFVTAGATGGGGSNYTGSYSSTRSVSYTTP